MRKVTFTISRGKGDRSQYLYGEIRDAETNEILVNASASYCADIINERKYHIIFMKVEE